MPHSWSRLCWRRWTLVARGQARAFASRINARWAARTRTLAAWQVCVVCVHVYAGPCVQGPVPAATARTAAFSTRAAGGVSYPARRGIPRGVVSRAAWFTFRTYAMRNRQSSRNSEIGKPAAKRDNSIRMVSERDWLSIMPCLNRMRPSMEGADPRGHSWRGMLGGRPSTGRSSRRP